MADDKDRSTQIAGLTSQKPPSAQMRYVWPAIVVLLLLIAAFAGFIFWSRGHDQQVAESAGDASLDKPAAQECAIARAVLSAVHAAGDDARWQADVGATSMTLQSQSRTVNPVDVPGYTDDEADNFRSKTAGDWRWCAGMGGFVRGLGWTPMGDDADVARLGLGRPGMDTAGDEARVYMTFNAPTGGDSDTPRPKRGPWLVTLHHDGPGGAWRVAGRADLSAGH